MSAGTTVPELAAGAEPIAPERCVRELLALAATAPTERDFLRAALPWIAARFDGASVAIEVRRGATTVEERHAAAGADPEFWREPVDHALLEVLSQGHAEARTYRNEEGVVGIASLAVPLLEPDATTTGALALIARCGSASEANAKLGELQAIAALLAATRTPRAQPARESAGAREAHSALRRVAAFASAQELCFTIANQLRNKSGCERVGVARVAGSKVELACLSGLAEVQLDSPRVNALVAALAECLDHGPRLVCQNRDPAGDPALPSSPHRLHRAWHEQCGGASVASLRLDDRGAPRLLLAFERAAERPYRAEELDELEKMVRPYVGALELLDRARAGLLAHAWRALREALQELAAPRRFLRKAVTIAALAAGTWVATGELPHEITARAELRAATARRICAPLDGLLAAAPHRPGDRVRTGDVLARFEPRELELAERRLSHEIAAARLEERHAFAERELNEASIARARRAELEARLELCQLQIGQATLRAPFDGWLLRGDLREQVGARFERGTDLFEVAPGHDLEFAIELPEAQVDAVRAGLSARFRPFARPEHHESLRIERIAPVAEPRAGGTVFVVTALPTAGCEELRPGMEGTAVIEADRRPVWWIATHRALDWLRLHAWP